MIRICSSLATAGYHVTLVGRKTGSSLPLVMHPFHQKRLHCFFSKGKLFYLEYNLRLFFFLLFYKIDIVCAIDLDTILPCFFVSVVKRIPRVYDAHELFCEMKEIATRPFIYKSWKAIERFAVPRYQLGYTVNQPIAEEFKQLYNVNYTVIRNIPLFRDIVIPQKPERYLLYQGAVNEGRSFETLIPAMRDVNARLLICGDGNFMKQAKELVLQHGLSDKVVFKGAMLPADLRQVTLLAWAGITLFDAEGKSNFISLANRFFDYMHAGLPQVCVNYPVYREINNQYDIAVLVDDVSSKSITAALNELLMNDELYTRLQHNCIVARKELNWQEEEKRLLHFYQTHFD
ncbi:MAG: glycosyltransferase family 4 protein [Chitinophagaceae bacterium]|nr:glycosyltransferase family 4 protein [Chitinophagaceae bacterium]